MMIKVAYRAIRAFLRTGINYCRKRSYNGSVFRVPVINGMHCNPTEPWMNDSLSLALNMRKGLFVDVGANVGQTLLKVKSIEPGREYLGFEPNPACNYYLQNLVDQNKLQECTLVPAAISDQSGVVRLEFFNSSTTNTSASIIPKYRGNRVPVQIRHVPVLSGEDIARCLDMSRLGVLKIDVEGAELEVLRALSDVISQSRPIIFFEVLPCRSEEDTMRLGRQNQIEAIFREANYTVFRICKEAGESFLGLEEIGAFGFHDDLSMTDYVAVPSDDLGLLPEGVLLQ